MRYSTESSLLGNHRYADYAHRNWGAPAVAEVITHRVEVDSLAERRRIRPGPLPIARKT